MIIRPETTDIPGFDAHGVDVLHREGANVLGEELTAAGVVLDGYQIVLTVGVGEYPNKSILLTSPDDAAHLGRLLIDRAAELYRKLNR